MNLSKLHSEEPQILGGTVECLMTAAAWRPELVHPCHKDACCFITLCSGAV